MNDLYYDKMIKYKKKLELLFNEMDINISDMYNDLINIEKMIFNNKINYIDLINKIINYLSNPIIEIQIMDLDLDNLKLLISYDTKKNIMLYNNEKFIIELNKYLNDKIYILKNQKINKKQLIILLLFLDDIIKIIIDIIKIFIII